LLGIETEDWKKIKPVFVEVHDLDDRLDKISNSLQDQGFANIKVEQEAILKGLTNLRLLRHPWFLSLSEYPLIAYFLFFYYFRITGTIFPVSCCLLYH
jgi:hypothetical protein